MTTTVCLIATLLAILTIPFALLFWATESRHTRIQRMHRNGMTWKQIGARYGVHRTTAARWSMAEVNDLEGQPITITACSLRLPKMLALNG